MLTSSRHLCDTMSDLIHLDETEKAMVHLDTSCESPQPEPVPSAFKMSAKLCVEVAGATVSLQTLRQLKSSSSSMLCLLVIFICFLGVWETLKL